MDEQKKIKDRIKKTVIAGIAGIKFLMEDKKIIDKKEIESILPHRGRILLLDRVIITSEKIIGELLVTKEICEGHFDPPSFPGVYYAEMTAQLVGIWLAQQVAQHPDLSNKIPSFKEAHFKTFGRDFTVPGDLLKVEIFIKEREEEKGEEGNPRIERVRTEDRPERATQRVIAEGATVWAGDQKKATIHFLELATL